MCVGSTADLISDVAGEAEAALAAAFDDARTRSPSVLFIDEIDGIAAARDREGDAGGGGAGLRALSVLLTEMDGMVRRRASPYVVLGATNRPDAIDPALRRP